PPPSGGAPAPAPLAVQVEFEAGATEATFLAPSSPPASPFLTTKRTLHLPLRAFLLGQLAGTASQYRYRVRVIFASGETIGDWKTDARDTLFIAVPGGSG